MNPDFCNLDWQCIEYSYSLYRTKVPGGWLVFHSGNGGLTFVPDKRYEWDVKEDGGGGD